ncbi:immunity 26/phosphotriesterase HocA family protein [Metasolibacillus meyeri]|uniref:Immunity 26/phosphotriesterase HocA family protein n=1 Tax=Metasolibacillus meyeri TaxID=1071052 RepID=A0AAW9NW77_9BACL|nr:immunity 26/phosphotriesterase HocA family protein [Metasolibacillus meyeri]MEC1179231.1 immunity 26/phosphotriesterase HocA family protein [Metasolibacillus meyeri]
MTNDKRQFFKLQPIQESWDLVKLTDECTIYFDGDIIVKRIDQTESSYLEKDISIATRARQYILPKTARGKEKKLTYPSLYSRYDGTLLFKYGVYNNKGYIDLEHVETKRSLPIPGFDAENLVQVEEHLTQFITSPPHTYQNKLEQLFTKLKRHKIKVGDVFKVERSMTTHGYVVVIGDVTKMRKEGMFAKESIWHDLMAVPLFVRVYHIETDKDLALEEIANLPFYEGCQIVMDDQFMRGQYPFVANKQLTEEDIELPFGFGPSLSFEDNSSRISWGLATVSKGGSPERYGAPLQYNLNHGVSYGVTFNHIPFNQENYEAAFEFFSMERLDFDTFNERYNGLTKAQYLDYVQPKK